MTNERWPRRPARAADTTIRGKEERVGRWEQWLARAVLALGRSPWGQPGHGQARGLLHIFRLVSWLAECLHPLHPVRAEGVLRYEVMALPTRRSLPLPGRAPVRHGEPVVGIHFDNRVIATLAASFPDTRRLTWQLARIAVQDLQQLAYLARAGALPPNARAVWAESLFYHSLARYGFSTRPARRTLRTPFARLFMLSLLAIHGRPGQAARERSLQRLQLGEGWIGIAELQQRYPPVETTRAVKHPAGRHAGRQVPTGPGRAASSLE